jgi:uracil-DNA glycosylase family 4
MPAPLQQLVTLASTLEGIDVDCYARHGQDQTKPVIGLGRVDARWCFVGRDPGEQEVRLQTPFIGDSGQKIRAVMADCDVRADDVYWMNTVPFKPIGNKAWPVGVRRQCRPALLELLAGWQGSAVITFGEAAFRWFGLGDAADRLVIDRFWGRTDKYEAILPISIELGGVERRLILHPVPHPSRANAAWVNRFPALLAARLRAGASPTD